MNMRKILYVLLSDSSLARWPRHSKPTFSAMWNYRERRENLDYYGGDL